MDRSIPADLNVSAKQIHINGVVQGVGFRPFLFVLAKKHHLTGEVSNTEDGVCLCIQGQADHLNHFIEDIIPHKPLLSQIVEIKTKNIPARDFNSFKIIKSRPLENGSGKKRATLISPDVAVCTDCRSELANPLDRRFEYPFINCTNCGPRYTIIKDIPYDRPKTSMKTFKMCTACQKEYDDPLDRRFHAQPNACPECGPHIWLTDHTGLTVEEEPKSVLESAAHYLGQGKIIGIKGLGGFHLACDAADPDAVKRLRRQKNRPHKPFALMAVNTKALLNHVNIKEDEKEVLESYHSPIVLLEKKQKTDHLPPGQTIAPQVAPLNNYLGCMLPSTPLHHLILEKGPDILVMTSGNRSGEPLSIENEDALDAFSHIADFFLLHNRDIFFGADDSVVRIMDQKTSFIRRSRGYAPLPVYLSKKTAPVLACGGGLKSTICLTRGKHAFLSPHIGDLDNAKVFEYYKKNIDHLKRILDIDPQIIAHDMHPGYMSSQYAKAYHPDQKKYKTVAVQHHHAHAVSCMAENHLDKTDEPVLAITLDGTGYGTDGHIWGGEILAASSRSFTRKAHLSYLPMPGGDAAVLQPWRMAVSVLFQAFGEDLIDLDLPFLEQLEKEKISFICQMMEKGLNSPLTSSTGRLFDALAALLDICTIISYESQAAMELEAVAGDMQGQVYDYHILNPEQIQDNPYEGLGTTAVRETKNSNDKELPYEIDLLPAFGQIVQDMGMGVSKGRISASFHDTLVHAFCAAALQISRDTRITTIVLSGGVFHNKRILTHMTHSLESKGLKVYTHSSVPAGDGGISLGQAVIAAALEES